MQEINILYSIVEIKYLFLKYFLDCEEFEILNSFYFECGKQFNVVVV